MVDIRKLTLSFLVFSPTMVSFASYGGMVSRSGFSGAGHQDTSNTIYLPNFVLVGLVKLSSSLSLNLRSSLDNDFIFSFKQEG